MDVVRYRGWGETKRVLGNSKREGKLEAKTRVKPKVAMCEMHRKGRECLDWRRDSGRLGDAKEGKDEVSGLAKQVSERERHGLASCRMKGVGESKGDEEIGTERRR